MRMQTQFSDSIDLRKLERENRPLLWFGFLAAVLLHAGLAFFMPYRTPQALRTERIESKRIIRADIIEIPARPYDSPPIVRKPGFANRGRRTGEIRRAGPALPGLPGPGVIKRPVPFAAGESPYAFQYEPQQPGMPGPDLDSRFKAPKRFETLEPHRRIVSRNLPLREEALKPEDYIWSKEGQRIGMIEYNPGNKLAIRGITPIPVLFANGGACLSPGMDGFREGILKYTDLTVGRIRHLFLIQNTPLDYPFFYIAFEGGFDSNPLEFQALRRYVMNGGFVFFEALGSGPARKSAERITRQGIEQVFGRNVRLEPIPNDHPIYSCYFDFPDGPPVYEKYLEDEFGGLEKQPFLEGVFLRGRLAAVFSKYGYGLRWNNPDGGGAGLRMGINLLVYALRQEGGNTVKRHDYALGPGIKAQRNIAGLVLTPEAGVR